MIPNLQVMAIGGVALAAAGGFFGYQWGVDRGLAQAAEKIAPRIEQLQGEIATLGTEKAQCQGEVAKYNTASAALVEENRLALEKGQAERDAATKRMEELLVLASKDAKRSATNSEIARKAIENVADQCARAGVPADVLSVLDDILSPPGAGVRNDAMPAKPGADRP